ncbi:MAG: SLC13 family permease [Rhodospirillaceae bacterium]|nr:SLC13 family permease [Rhodospirillaceae bacterium]
MMLPDPHALFLLALTPVAFILFTIDRIPLAQTAMTLLVVLVLAFSLFPYAGPNGAFGPKDVFVSFGNEALVAICSLMILGQGLTLTGALEPVARFVSSLWNLSSHVAMLFVLVMCMAVSGLLNDTPIVVLMIPILLGVAVRTGAAPARLLLPMNYAVLVGGMGTTIGTSTNILVISIATGLGLGPFGIFDFVHVTAIAAIPAIIYLWLVAPLLLRGVPSEATVENLRLFDAWLHVPEDSPWIGRSLMELFEKGLSRQSLLEIKRAHTIFLMRSPTLLLQAGDSLLVRDSRDNLTRLSAEFKLPLHDLDKDDLAEIEQIGPAAADLQVAELVVSQDSPLVGSTLRAERLAERIGLIVLGVRPFQAARKTKTSQLSDLVIHGGDVLLVQASPDVLKAVRSDSGFLVLDGALTLPRTRKAPIAILIMAVVVAAAAAKVLPISTAALVGALLMFATSCLTWSDVGESLSINVILMVAASLALGSALTVTGGTEFLATAYLSAVRGLPPELILGSMLLLIALLTNFVSNNAAAAIGTPVAVSIATQLGVSPMPFVLAVLFGANFSYITPMAYQTNLMVMGAAGYRFKDFVIVGTPLLLIMLAMYAWLLPKFFPLAS